MRVAWTETRNLMADTVDKAWRFMAYTAKSHERLKQAAGVKATGRKLEKPVFTYSLSWHPEQSPTKREMLKAADDSLKALGLEEHQVIISCHRDEPQPHVHLIVNRTHPLTGVAAKLSRSKCKLSDFARVFERKEGTDYCPAREENHQKRKAGKRTKHGDPVIVNAWAKSNNGKEFVAALEAEVTHWQTAIGVLSSLIATEKRSTPFVSLKA
ncbi:MAG: relaxase/mobilization nuclease domain-containing protein [Opitutales bacterium]|nr:relaxase/mobilization nuclease domain-containing protein [Opitutales bacterium]